MISNINEPIDLTDNHDLNNTNIIDNIPPINNSNHSSTTLMIKSSTMNKHYH
jgi:hypothetical protein